MSNISSSNLDSFAELIGGHDEDSIVNGKIAEIIIALSKMTDNEVLSLDLSSLGKITVWNSLQHGYNQALQLPLGTLIVGCFEVEVKPEELKKAVDVLKLNPNGTFLEAVTQAEVIRKAFPDI